MKWGQTKWVDSNVKTCAFIRPYGQQGKILLAYTSQRIKATFCMNTLNKPVTFPVWHLWLYSVYATNNTFLNNQQSTFKEKARAVFSEYWLWISSVTSFCNLRSVYMKIIGGSLPCVKLMFQSSLSKTASLPLKTCH